MQDLVCVQKKMIETSQFLSLYLIFLENNHNLICLFFILRELDLGFSHIGLESLLV